MTIYSKANNKLCKNHHEFPLKKKKLAVTNNLFWQTISQVTFEMVIYDWTILVFDFDSIAENGIMNKMCYQYLCFWSMMGTILLSTYILELERFFFFFKSTNFHSCLISDVTVFLFFPQIYTFLICIFSTCIFYICIFDIYILDICILNICISEVRSLFLFQFWFFFSLKCTNCPSCLIFDVSESDFNGSVPCI